MKVGQRSLLISTLLVACGGKNGQADTCGAFDPWQTGGDGADVSAPPPAGEVRAGRIRGEVEVPHGAKNQAEVGDFVMRNGRVLFVVEEPGTSDGYQPFGGGIVHADLVGPDGEPLGLSLFGESFHGIALALVDPESVSVMADGSDGSEAVVRVVGPMRNMPLLDVAFGFFFESSHGATYILDYALAPDSDYLELRLHVRNPNPAWAYVNLFIFGSIQGDGLALFTPEGGFDLEALSGSHDLFGHVGDGISYGWMDAEGGSLRYVMEESGIVVGDKGATVQMEGCSETTVPLIRLLVAPGGAEALLGTARRVMGEDEPPPTTFAVSVDGGGGASEALVHVTREDGSYVTTARSVSGTWSAGIPEGAYLATGILAGHPPARDIPFTVDAGGASVDVAIPEAATVTYAVTDGADPIPAKLLFVPADPPETLPACFGLRTNPDGAYAYIFDPHGSASIPLPPGDYTAIATRGYEYEAATEEITATAGAVTTLDLVLDRSVDSTGILCGDFHVHSLLSPDTSTPRALKVHAAAAEGIEILSSTDHEWIADYQTDVEAEGLGAWVHGISGEEITTYDYGHFNAYPMTVHVDLPNNGAVDWYYREPSAVFGDVRSDTLDPVLQVNHPRGAAISGYFDAVGFDPVEGTFSRPELWDPDFQAVEIFNSEDFRSQQDGTVTDWFAFLDMGMRIAAMGNSDSHDIPWSEMGFPRSCLVLGHDSTSDLTHLEVRDAVKAMGVTVSGGILVTALGPGSEGPGEIVDAPSGTADIQVMVQAPTWMSADRLRMFVSGEEVETITLDASTADPTNPAIRFDDTITVATDGSDGWVVFEAEGDTAMPYATPGRRPFGMTNPIYLDADGDGAITPRRPLPGP